MRIKINIKINIIFIIALTSLLTGCTSRRYYCSTGRQSKYTFQKKFKFIEIQLDKGVIFQNTTTSFNPELFTLVANLRYPQLFSNSLNSIPVRINIKNDTSDATFFTLINLVFGLGVIPVYYQSQSDLNCDFVILDKWGEQMISDKKSFTAGIVRWTSFFSPLGLIPVPLKTEFENVSSSQPGRQFSIDGQKPQLLVSNGIIDSFVQSVKTKRREIYVKVLQTTIEKRFAVLVGAGEYAKLNSIIFSEDDARDISKFLIKKKWDKEKIKHLLDKDITLNNIEGKLDNYLSNASYKDMVVLFWSGRTYVDPKRSHDIYLATYNTEISRPWSGYRLDAVIQALKEQKAENVIIVFDLVAGQGKIVFTKERLNKYKLPPNWIFIINEIPSRKIIENSRWANGPLTKCFINGLQGDADGIDNIDEKEGIVTIKEIVKYLKQKMPVLTRKEFGVSLKPTILYSDPNSQIWNMTLDNN